MITSQLPGRDTPVTDRPVVADGGSVIGRTRGAGESGGDSMLQRGTVASLHEEV
jgi:hypothetical protein